MYCIIVINLNGLPMCVHCFEEVSRAKYTKSPRGGGGSQQCQQEHVRSCPTRDTHETFDKSARRQGQNSHKEHKGTRFCPRTNSHRTNFVLTLLGQKYIKLGQTEILIGQKVFCPISLGVEIPILSYIWGIFRS